MLSKLTKILILLAISLYVLHFFFFWMFESTDSLFYFQFSQFLRTGKYITPHPYYYRVPSTMEPPLYSVFLYFAQIVKRADIIIHFAQLAGLLMSAFFIFRIFRDYFGREFAGITSVVFLLTPAHFIYSSNLVAEPIAVFYITLYLYIAYQIICKKKRNLIKYLVVYSSLIMLQRYNLATLFLFSILIFILFRQKKRVDFIYLFISFLILLGWVLINHNLNGSWGLSNAEGKHLYNRILHFDRLLPEEDNPNFIKFKSIVGEEIDYFKPWWFYEPQLIAELGSETKSSDLLKDVALAALKRDPLKYVVNTPGFFLFAHGTNPTYNDDLYLWGGKMQKNCRILGNIEFCNPIIKTKVAPKAWDIMVSAVDNYYLKLAKYINLLLLFPALIYSFFQKEKFIKFVAIIYIISILLFVLVEAPLPRYTYIFIPMRIILIFYIIGNIVCLYCKRLKTYIQLKS